MCEREKFLERSINVQKWSLLEMDRMKLDLCVSRKHTILSRLLHLCSVDDLTFLDCKAKLL